MYERARGAVESSGEECVTHKIEPQKSTCLSGACVCVERNSMRHGQGEPGIYELNSCQVHTGLGIIEILNSQSAFEAFGRGTQRVKSRTPQNSGTKLLPP